MEEKDDVNLEKDNQENVPGFWTLMGILSLGLFASLLLSGRIGMIVNFVTGWFR